MKRTEIIEALGMKASDTEINVKGWVRTKRGSKNVAFIALNDGSTLKNLQLVVDLEKIPESELALMHTGASVSANGLLIPSAGSGQSVELAVNSIELLGAADPDDIRCNLRNTHSNFFAKRHIFVTVQVHLVRSHVCVTI